MSNRKDLGMDEIKLLEREAEYHELEARMCREAIEELKERELWTFTRY